ncbi:hypothetical protein [Pararhodobacter oceanensis]|uniref:hypothetical protein n=1 Tax=Pararhodobacter oceanensis TaxID=2172121 RepID=UPI003A8DE288
MAGQPTILLHLGTHKTGTTSLQHNFARHRKVLREEGVRFFGPGRAYPHLYSAFLDDPMVDAWNRLSGLDATQIKSRDRAALAELQQRLTRKRFPWVILSNEYLALLPAEALAALRDWLAPYGRVMAVYGYRELRDWMSSDTQQMAKSGLGTRRTTFDIGLQRIADFPAKIAQVFGVENTRFLRFEDAKKIGVCNHFLQSFGLPDFTALGLGESRQNVSISGPAVEALLAYNRAHPLGSGRRDAAEVARIKALPGPRFDIGAFTAGEIARYAEAYPLARRLGLRIAAPDELERQPRLAGVRDRLARGLHR